jgi:hypothetical protein
MISYLMKSQELIENYDDYEDIEIKSTLNLTLNEKNRILLNYNINDQNYQSTSFLNKNVNRTTSLMMIDSYSTSGSYNQDCLKQDQAEINTTNFLVNLTNHMLIVFPWIMILLGTVSNVISFIVFTRPKLRKSSTFFYLSCLCIIDILSIYTVCGNMLFYYHFGIDLQKKSLVVCKLYSFLIYFLPQFSAWTCAAVSLDRVVSVIFSVRGKHAAAAKKFNTPQKALQVELVIFFLLFLLNVQFFFYPNEFEFQKDQVQDINIIYCSPENIPRYETFYAFWVYIDLSVNVLIPFFIMIISSIIIIVGVFNSTKNMTARGNTQKEIKKSVKQNNNNNNRKNSTTNETNTVRFKTTTEPLIELSKNNDKSALKQSSLNRTSNKNHSSGAGASSKAKNVSTMLATNNIVFISLALPIVVFLSITPSFREPTLCNHVRAKLRLIKIICIILMNTNYCINLFIYTFMASQFRIQLFSLIDQVFFCIKFKKSSSETINTSKTATIKQSQYLSKQQQSMQPISITNNKSDKFYSNKTSDDSNEQNNKNVDINNNGKNNNDDDDIL